MQACDKPDGYISLPYSIGVLVAYAFQNPIIKNEYIICDLFAEKLKPEKYLELIEEPDVFAFSCYIWNFEYSKQLASLIKQAYPDCVIIFGGHSIPIDNSELLLEMPYVDFFIHGEGEIPFSELLLHIAGRRSVDSVNNVSYLLNGKIHYNYNPDCVVPDYPSPYLTGVFNKMMSGTKQKFNATIETNRGCPFCCAYCDWGLNQSRLRMMNLDKILAEIEWMGRHKIMICNGADSNFGMFPRDLYIARKIEEVKKTFGYPKKFSVSFSKKSDKKVLEISRILNNCGVLAGVTISFQSLNPKTLKIIGRENLSAEHFNSLIAKYNEERIPTYSELILGLPGETYESFASGICELITYGQYRYINVYDFALLVNSELGKKINKEKYGIKTVKMPLKKYYCKSDDFREIREYADIVVGTSDMSRAEWIDCRMFTSVVKGFHSFGILLYIASFLHHEGKADYKEFYKSLYSWIVENRFFQVYADLKKWYMKISEGNEDVNGFQEFRNSICIPPEEAAFLRMIEDIDNIYSELEAFLVRYLGEDILCREELLRFQRSVFCGIYDKKYDCLYEEYNYDFISYFNSVALGEHAVLTKKRFILTKDVIETMLLLPKKIYV